MTAPDKQENDQFWGNGMTMPEQFRVVVEHYAALIAKHRKGGA